MICNVCEGTGFKNFDFLPLGIAEDDMKAALKYVKENPNSDISVCDCCGDGEEWYGVPGEHYGHDDPPGLNGPYASNGGLCKCH